jgi:hypothetical protein
MYRLSYFSHAKCAEHIQQKSQICLVLLITCPLAQSPMKDMAFSYDLSAYHHIPSPQYEVMTYPVLWHSIHSAPVSLVVMSYKTGSTTNNRSAPHLEGMIWSRYHFLLTYFIHKFIRQKYTPKYCWSISDFKVPAQKQPYLYNQWMELKE